MHKRDMSRKFLYTSLVWSTHCVPDVYVGSMRMGKRMVAFVIIQWREWTKERTKNTYLVDTFVFMRQQWGYNERNYAEGKIRRLPHPPKVVVWVERAIKIFIFWKTMKNDNIQKCMNDVTKPFRKTVIILCALE